MQLASNAFSARRKKRCLARYVTVTLTVTVTVSVSVRVTVGVGVRVSVRVTATVHKRPQMLSAWLS